MDEVRTMTDAGAKVGEALGHGLHTARLKANKAVALAEHKLADHGMSPQQLQEMLTENASTAKDKVAKSTRKARKQLAKETKAASKELARRTTKAGKQAKQVGQDLASVLEPASRRRRRWPWVLGLLVAAAGTAYVVLSRRPREVYLQDELDEESGTEDKKDS